MNAHTPDFDPEDRKYMGSPEDAKAALIAQARAWRLYRQQALKSMEARERECRFQLANAALLWLWHEEHP